MKYKVIIIDDEPPIRKALCKIISQRIPECYVVGEADNGIDGMMQPAFPLPLCYLDCKYRRKRKISWIRR